MDILIISGHTLSGHMSLAKTAITLRLISNSDDDTLPGAITEAIELPHLICRAKISLDI